MATPKTFVATLKDINENIHTITIYRPNQTDEKYRINFSGVNTPTITHRGGDKDTWDSSVIQGVEFTYEFYFDTTEVWIAELLMESPFGTYYLKHEIERTAIGQPFPSVNFIGIIKPENMICDFHPSPPYVNFIISVTDAMGDLKEVGFTNSSFVHEPGYVDRSYLLSGRKCILEILNLALATRVNIHTSGYFFITLSTYENNLMSYGECPLEKIYVECERFADSDGNVMSCYDVIEAVLKPFNCKFYAMGGLYYITNFSEYGTITPPRFIYAIGNWTTGAFDEGNMSIDISSYYFLTSMEKQKVQPVNSVEVILKNIDVGGSVVEDTINLLDPVSYTTTFDDIYTGTSSDNPNVNSLYLYSEHTSAKHEDTLELASDFNIDTTGQDDNFILRIQMEYKIIQLTTSMSTSRDMHISIQIKRPGTIGGWTSELVQVALNEQGWLKFDSSGYEAFRLLNNGSFNIRLIFKPNQYAFWDWDTLLIEIKNISIDKIIDVENSYEPINVIKDQLYQQFNQIPCRGKIEEEVLVGDGKQTTELAALSNVDGTLTSSWARYTMTEDLKLVNTYVRNILKNRSVYKDFLRLTIIDRNHLIDPFHSVYLIRSIDTRGKSYVFSTYSKNYRTGEIEAELIELKTDSTYS